MRVLLTGAFGNIGVSTLEALLEQGHAVTCFDVKTRANAKRARRFKNRVKVVWGDLRNPEDVAQAVRGHDVVVHLAFVIPTYSVTGVGCEERPDWAWEINVGGTRHVIEALQALPEPPRLIFASSLHVYGRTQENPPPRTVADPVQATDHYTRHKIACERMVKASGLEWTILRFAAALPLSLRLDVGLFDVPLDNRMEFVHTRDVGVAVANAVSSEEVWGKILLIGGGPRCQLRFREIATRLLDAMGIGMLPEEAFTTVQFATDWMDTTESQEILRYQTRGFSDYTEEMASLLGPRRGLLRLFHPLVRRWLLNKSPYYGVSDWREKVAVVTGASSGIGAATAKALAGRGLKVVLVARRENRLNNLATEIRAAGGEALVITADLSDEQERLRVHRTVRATYGGADVLVNGAGFGWYGFGSEMPWPLAQRMMQVNVEAVVHLTHLFLQDMKANKGGHVINIGSVAGQLPSQGVALYSATKSFVEAFTTALYRELRGTNVHVSVVNSGAVADTEFYQSASALAGASQMPAERFGVKPEVLADRIWGLLVKPRRAIYVPRFLGLVPLLEVYFGWLMDRIGPVLLKRQARAAENHQAS